MAIHALKNPFTNEGLIHRPTHFTSIRTTDDNDTSSNYGIMNDNDSSNANLRNDTVYKILKEILRMNLMM